MPDEVDYANAEQVGLDLAVALAPGVTTVIADFTPTEFLDSSGMQVIVRVHRRAAATNVGFRVVVPSARLLDYLTGVGLAGYLSIYPSLAGALPPAGLVPEGRSAADLGPSGLTL
jgi:anti-sigma B factor antagonist